MKKSARQKALDEMLSKPTFLKSAKKEPKYRVKLKKPYKLVTGIYV